MVALIKTSGTNYKNRHYCGGSLIGQSWALTVAHCIVTPHSTKTFPTTVVVGAWDLTDWQNEGDTEIPAPEERVVDDVLIHEKYYDKPMDPVTGVRGPYDVALLHLKEPLSLHGPVTIAEKAPAVGTPVEVMGWGDTIHPGEDYPDKLQIVEVCVLNNAKCPSSLNPSVEKCYGDPPEKQTTGGGDSGGPVILDNKQVGIHSRGRQWLYTSTFGDAVALKPWIENQIDSWTLTTATNCGYCESSLNKASPSSGTINSADECWLDCLRTYVNDDFDDETLWAIDWYPDTKVCKCQSSCDTLGVGDDPVVVIARGENYFFPPECLTPMPTPTPTPAPTPAPTPLPTPAPTPRPTPPATTP